MSNHEESVRDFLNAKAPGWADEKDRGWHNDRYFEQEREREVSFWTRDGSKLNAAVERQTAGHDRPKLTREQKIAKRMIEIEQARYASFPHLPGLDLAELAAMAERGMPQPGKTVQRKIRDKQDAAYVLREGFGVDGARVAAILNQASTTTRVQINRLREQLRDDFDLRAELEAEIGRKGFVVVSLPPVPNTVS